jgi:hypothetical protein
MTPTSHAQLSRAAMSANRAGDDWIADANASVPGW